MKIFNSKQFEHIVHELKTERQSSYYADFIMTWNHDTLSGEWLQTYLQIFIKNVKIPQYFINKYNIKEYHINLIRRMYFDSYNLENCIVNLSYKRPYGNSNVMHDIFEEYVATIENIVLTEDEEETGYEKFVNKNGNNFLPNIHNETMNFLDLMLKELKLNYDEWQKDETSWFANWKPTKKALRKSKLNRIIYD